MGEETPHRRNERVIADWTRRLGYLSIVTVATTVVTVYILYRTDETARASNRAFVTATGLRIEPAGNPGGYTVAVLFENSGNTPTINLKWGGKPNTHDEIVMPQSTVESIAGRPIRLATKDVIYSGLIGPKSIVTPYITTLWPVDIAEIRAKKIKPVFYGAISYRDIFKGEHTTFYCFTLYYEITMQGADGPPGYLPCSGKTNCADDECKTGE